VTIKRGDGWTKKIVVKVGGVAIDITRYIVRFTVKKTTDSVTDTDALIKKDLTTFPNGDEGECLISLTKEDTAIAPGVYYYDIQIEDNIGGEPKTPIVAKFTVTGDVTRRTRADD